MGAAISDIGEPLFNLLLTSSDQYRKIFTDKNGACISRLEVSFYNSSLLLPDIYTNIINEIFPSNQEGKIFNLKCFTPVKVRDYFKTLFEGEKKHGRFIFLEELEDERIKLTFIRFINQLTKNIKRKIGFE